MVSKGHSQEKITVKCRTAMQVLFIYYNLCPSVTGIIPIHYTGNGNFSTIEFLPLILVEMLPFPQWNYSHLFYRKCFLFHIGNFSFFAMKIMGNGVQRTQSRENNCEM
jgi:hypothetical protein